MGDFDTLIRESTRSPRVQGSITFATGVTRHLSAKDILGFIVHEGISDGMLLGTAISASCAVTLSGAGGAWRPGGEMRAQNPLVGAYVRLSLALDGTSETRDVCAFYVSAVHMAENDARVTLTGGDALSTVFNAPYIDDQAYPRALSEIATSVAAQAGHTIDPDFINADVVIAQKPDWGNISLRGAMGYIACAAASFAHMDRGGGLRLVPVFDRQTAYVLPPKNTLARVYGEIAMGAIGAVIVTPKGKKSEQIDETYALDGVIATNSNTLRIRNNPLFAANVVHTPLLSEGVLSAVSGMTLTRAQVSWQGDPALTIGRRLKIIDHEGNETVTSVTRQEMRYENGFSMKSDCTLRSVYDTGAGTLINAQGEISASRLTGEMDGALIRAGTIAAASLMAGSVTAAHLAAGSVGAEQIAADAITSEKIASGAVTADKLSADVAHMVDARIENATIGTAQIADASITTAKIANAAVGTAKIADASITHAKIGTAAVGTANIETGAITTALIGTGAVETAQIADGSITDAKIVSLTASKLTAGTIDASVIAVNNLTADNITAGTINGQRIPVLGTEKLADGAVTGDKVAQNAITADKIVSGAVTAEKIAASAVTANKIASNAVTAGKINAGAITTEKLAANAVTASKIAALDGALSIVSGGALNVQSAQTRFATDDFTITNENGDRELFAVETGSVAIGADVLVADNIIGNVVNVYAGGTVPWRGSVQATLDSIPKYLKNDTRVSIPAGTHTERVAVRGFKGANLLILLASGATLIGKLSIQHCDDVIIRGGDVETSRVIAADTGDASDAVEVVHSHVFMERITLSGNLARTASADSTHYGIQTDYSVLHLRNLCIERMRTAIRYQYGSTGVVENCTGGVVNGTSAATQANLERSIIAYRGSHVGVYGTIPAAVNGTQANVATIVGTATETGSPGTAPVVLTQTATLTATGAGQYRRASGADWTERWSDAYQPAQGSYQRGDYWGAWVFGTQLNTLVSSAAAIEKATLTVTRSTAYGSSGAVEIRLMANTMETIDTVTYMQPPVQTLVATAAMERGQSYTFDVTALVQELKSGARTALGFGLSKNGNFAYMKQEAVLNITYR